MSAPNGETTPEPSPRVPSVDRVTIQQLRTLAEVIERGSFSSAAASLGLHDTHQALRTINRLAENLGISSLAPRDGDELHLHPDLRQLDHIAVDALALISRLEAATARLADHTILLRCLTYPSLVVQLVAHAIAEFEARSSGGFSRQVRLPDLESRNRRVAGSSIMRPLMSGAVDVVIGPTKPIPTESPVKTRELFRWNVVAAVGEGHPLRARGGPTVEVADVARYPVLISPRGHQTRSLLDAAAPTSGFRVELESSNSEARVALGRCGLRVPLVANDAIAGPAFDRDWPIVTSNGLPLSGTHCVAWRIDLPIEEQQALAEFVELVWVSAASLRKRPGGSLSKR